MSEVAFAGALVNILLLPYILAHFFITCISSLKGLLGKGASKVLSIKLPENEKRRYEKVFTIVWILVAVIGVILMAKEGMGSLGAIIAIPSLFGAANAFRSGANLSKKLIYRWHDS